MKKKARPEAFDVVKQYEQWKKKLTSANDLLDEL